MTDRTQRERGWGMDPAAPNVASPGIGEQRGSDFFLCTPRGKSPGRDTAYALSGGRSPHPGSPPRGQSRTTERINAMTDDMDDRRDQVRRLFNRDDRPPRDVVPGSGLTREALKAQNDAAGSVVDVTVPGELVEDVDGLPIGVGPSQTSSATVGGPVISQRDVERLGLTAEELETDYQNVTVWSPNEKENDHE